MRVSKMNLYYAMLLLALLFMFVLINGNCGEFMVEDTNCSAAGCEKLAISVMQSTRINEQQNRIMTITSDHNSYYGALISEKGNMTIDYSPIIHGNCEGVYNFVCSRPSNSIGVIFKSLPFIEGITNWHHEDPICNSDKCEFMSIGKENGKYVAQFREEVAANPSACQDGEMSSKTLTLHVKIISSRPEYLLSGGFSMLILVPTKVKLSILSAEGENSINFGSIEEPEGNPSVTIKTAKLSYWISGENLTIPIRATYLKEVIVEPRSTNLPVACFFQGHTSGRVYEVSIKFEHPYKYIQSYHLTFLTWSLTINLGDHSKSAASIIPALKTFGLIAMALCFLPIIRIW